jgi:hypothetical protein
MTSFENAGFLSEQTDEFRQQHLSRYKELFSLAYDMNLAAHDRIRGCQVNGNDLQHLVSICLYFRILNSFASTVILSEKGMCHDAEVIARAALEALFFLKRCAEDTAFVDEFVKSDQQQRLKLMNVAKDKNSCLHAEAKPTHFSASPFSRRLRVSSDYSSFTLFIDDLAKGPVRVPSAPPFFPPSAEKILKG